ncbi:MAG TPA: GPW/gp25 family protein [Allosphingosinicella sp.]|jgi:hypothetical protein
MKGMNAATGKPLSGEGHLRQSVADILTTMVGTRVGLRDYGSLLPELIDQPMNPAGQLRLFAATAVALMRWEPRLRLTRVTLDRGADPGAFDLTLFGTRTDTAPAAARTKLTVPLRARLANPAFA